MLKRRSRILLICLFVTVVVEVKAVGETTKEPTKKPSDTIGGTTTNKPKNTSTKKTAVKKPANKARGAEDEDLRFTPDELMTVKSKFIASCKQHKFCETFLNDNALGLRDCNSLCESAWQLAATRKKKGEDPLTPPKYTPEPEPTDTMDGSGEITKRGPGLGISGFKSKKDKTKGKKPKVSDKKELGNKKQNETENKDSEKEHKGDSRKESTTSNPKGAEQINMTTGSKMTTEATTVPKTTSNIKTSVTPGEASSESTTLNSTTTTTITTEFKVDANPTETTTVKTR